MSKLNAKTVKAEPLTMDKKEDLLSLHPPLIIIRYLPAKMKN